MKVRAIKEGFIHNHFKNIGDEFEVTAKEFSKKWMESLDVAEESASSKSRSKKADANVREPIAMSKIKPESVLPSNKEVI